MTADRTPGPGEKKSRARRRRYVAYMVLAAIVGGTLGAILNIGEGTATDLFVGDGPRSLDPLVAIPATALILFGFLALPVWGFTQIDELLRVQNFIGFTGGALAVLSGYPAWVVLSAAGMLSPPTAFGVFALALVGMMATFAVVKLRDRLT